MSDFTLRANVVCVDGQHTWFTLSFPNYTGTLSTDITSISLSGPSGLITNKISDFSFYDDMNQLFMNQHNQAPELGTYTFSVTIDGVTKEVYDTQSVNRYIPPVSKDSMIVSEDSTSELSVTFSWDAIPDPGYTTYYGIQVREPGTMNYHVNQRYLTETVYEATLDPGDYEWQIIVIDSNTWEEINNRSNGGWESFVII